MTYLDHYCRYYGYVFNRNGYLQVCVGWYVNRRPAERQLERRRKLVGLVGREREPGQVKRLGQLGASVGCQWSPSHCVIHTHNSTWQKLFVSQCLSNNMIKSIKQEQSKECQHNQRQSKEREKIKFIDPKSVTIATKSPERKASSLSATQKKIHDHQQLNQENRGGQRREVNERTLGRRGACVRIESRSVAAVWKRVRNGEKVLFCFQVSQVYMSVEECPGSGGSREWIDGRRGPWCVSYMKSYRRVSVSRWSADAMRGLVQQEWHGLLFFCFIFCSYFKDTHTHSAHTHIHQQILRIEFEEKGKL